jgi:hypothetical protein
MERNTNSRTPRTQRKFKWAIYPDYWKNSWGEKPLLGTVFADDEQHAIRKAYDHNLLPHNFTFGPSPVKITND